MSSRTDAGPRVAIVTGGNRGLGLECARQLLARGVTVLLGARDRQRGDAAAEALGGGVRAISLDVTSDDDVACCGELIRREHGGRLDILVNNAAVHYDSGQTPLGADWRVVVEAMDTNTYGAWRMARMAAPLMRAGRHGRIVNVSSSAGAWARSTPGTPHDWGIRRRRNRARTTTRSTRPFRA